MIKIRYTYICDVCHKWIDSDYSVAFNTQLPKLHIPDGWHVIDNDILVCPLHKVQILKDGGINDSKHIII